MENEMWYFPNIFKLFLVIQNHFIICIFNYRNIWKGNVTPRSIKYLRICSFRRHMIGRRCWPQKLMEEVFVCSICHEICTRFGYDLFCNSRPPGRCSSNYWCMIFKFIIQNSSLGTRCEIAPRQLLQNLTKWLTSYYLYFHYVLMHQ